MIVSSTDVQNNFGIKIQERSLADRLVGLIPPDVNEDKEKIERLARQ